MIVKNEAGNLAGCLDSIAGVTDEIVIADTGSSDETMSIAARYGARIIEIPWRNDFAEARNRAMARAAGDWILHLDADEMVDPEGARKIRALVDADGNGADAIEVTLANYCNDIRAWRWAPVKAQDVYAKGYAGYIKVGLLRLFRNRRGYEYREPVHENITESVLERNGTIRAEPIVIHHYGYDQQLPRAKEKREAYVNIARAKTRQYPAAPKAWHDLSELETAAGNNEAAETAARKALDLDPNHIGAATTLCNLLLNRGDLEEPREIFERFEAAGITPPHVLLTLGAIACRQGRLHEARAKLETVVANVPDAVLARLHLARTYDQLGDAGQARRFLQEAESAAPGLEESRNRLEALDLRTRGEEKYNSGDVIGSMHTLVDALKLDPYDPLIHNSLGIVLVSLEQFSKARESFGRALKLAPAMPEPKQNLNSIQKRK